MSGLLRLTFAALVFWITPPAQAQFLPELSTPFSVSDLATGPGEIWHGHFLAPNELDPSRMKVITSNAQSGLYVGVGTERTFIAAAINPQFTHALMADHDPWVVLYNRINIALLKASSSREEYLSARMRPAPNRWARLARTLTHTDPESASLLRDEDVVQWWQSQTLGEKQAEKMKPLHEPSSGAFEGSNYLHDDSLFSRLSQMAKEGRLQSIELDFSSPAALKKVVRTIQAKRLRLSVLDLSNAWQPVYLGLAATARAIEQFSALSDQAIWLGTQQIVTVRDRRGLSDFAYFGVEFKQMTQRTSRGAVIREFGSWDFKPLTHKELERMNPHLPPSGPDCQALFSKKI
jgi:hypothetical protein